MDNASWLVGGTECSPIRIEATVVITALEKLDVGPAIPALFGLALMTVAIKSLLTNFPHDPLVWQWPPRPGIIKKWSISRLAHSPGVNFTPIQNKYLTRPA